MSEPRLPLVPGGSGRDEVVAWFTMCMDGSSAARRGTLILDTLLAEARASLVAGIRDIMASNGYQGEDGTWYANVAGDYIIRDLSALLSEDSPTGPGS